MEIYTNRPHNHSDERRRRFTTAPKVPLTSPLTLPGARVISALSPPDVLAVYKLVMTVDKLPHVGPAPRLL
jgi:hypothetical protein